jgi:hypothetical protein
MKASPCFSDLASEFYLSINKEDLERALKTKQRFLSSGHFGLPLSTELKSFEKQPGWLWAKALTFAHNDSLLAMQLIGICGHDDRNLVEHEGEKGIPISDQKRAQLRKLIPSLAQISQVAKNDMRLGKTPFNGWENEQQIVEGAIAGTFSLKDGVGCPEKTSAFYAPKALSAEADISPQLKKRIASIQAPTAGPSVIPAKNYHVTGAAYTSCFLIRRGLPDIFARRMVMGALNVYRSSRVCEELKDNSDEGGTAPIYTAFNNLSTDAIIKAVLAQRSPEVAQKCAAETSRSNFCAIGATVSSMIKAELTDPDITPEILTKKTKHILAKLDSIQLFRASPLFEKSKGCQGQQLGSAVREFVHKNGSESFSIFQTPCLKSIPLERCRAARQLLTTYDVDFEWSEAQHIAGYEFARKNCSSYNPARPPEKVACEIEKENATLSGHTSNSNKPIH